MIAFFEQVSNLIDDSCHSAFAHGILGDLVQKMLSADLAMHIVVESVKDFLPHILAGWIFQLNSGRPHGKRTHGGYKPCSNRSVYLNAKKSKADHFTCITTRVMSSCTVFVSAHLSAAPQRCLMIVSGDSNATA